MVLIEKMLRSKRGTNNNHSDLHTEPNSDPSTLSRTPTRTPIPASTKQSVCDSDFNQHSDSHYSFNTSPPDSSSDTNDMLVPNAVIEKEMNNSYSDWHYISNVDMNNIITKEEMHKNGATKEKMHKNAVTDEDIQKNAVTEEKMHNNAVTEEKMHSMVQQDSDFDTDTDEYTLLHVRPRNRYRLQQQYRKFWKSRR